MSNKLVLFNFLQMMKLMDNGHIHLTTSYMQIIQ